MGFFWDHIDSRWREIDHDRVLTRGQRCRIERRQQLIEALIKEIERGHNPVTGLYARLLANALLKTDQQLMREVGARVAKLSPQGSKQSTR